jgi:hypothetical protein
MDNEKPPQVIDLSFDRDSETWYVDLQSEGRLDLSRQSLSHLIRLYNKIHRGDPLYLFDQERLNQFHNYNQRLSRTVRDLYHFIDKDREDRPAHRLRRLAVRVLNFLFPGGIPGR